MSNHTHNPPAPKATCSAETCPKPDPSPFQPTLPAFRGHCASTQYPRPKPGTLLGSRLSLSLHPSSVTTRFWRFHLLSLSETLLLDHVPTVFQIGFSQPLTCPSHGPLTAPHVDPLTAPHMHPLTTPHVDPLTAPHVHPLTAPHVHPHYSH